MTLTFSDLLLSKCESPKWLIERNSQNVPGNFLKYKSLLLFYCYLSPITIVYRLNSLLKTVCYNNLIYVI